MTTIKQEYLSANGQTCKVEFEISTGTKFIDGNGIIHTVEEINDDFVIHSYKWNGETISDGHIYRRVFEKLLCQQVLALID